MIGSLARDAGNYYEVETTIRGRGAEIEAEARAILKVIWSQEYGPKMIDSILGDFVDWCDKQTKEDK